MGLETMSKILQESDPSVVLKETQRGAGGKKIYKKRKAPKQEKNLEKWVGEISSTLILAKSSSFKQRRCSSIVDITVIQSPISSNFM